MGTRTSFRVLLAALAILAAGCSSNVRFIRTDETWEPAPKAGHGALVFERGKIRRPHRVVGIIEAELGRRARRPELDALIREKAREIGADGVMLVEYDVDRDVYVEHHHHVVGRGPWRHHVVTSEPRTRVKKTATAIAVVFPID
jgi:hypothetical protein